MREGLRRVWVEASGKVAAMEKGTCLAGLVLGHFVLRVFFAIFALTVGAAGFWDVDLEEVMAQVSSAKYIVDRFLELRWMSITSFVM